MSKRTGIALSIAAALSFGLCAVLSALAYGAGCPVPAMLALRSLFAAAVVALCAGRQRLTLRLSPRKASLLLIWGFCGSALTNVLLNLSYLFIPAGPATALHFMYPALVCLGEALIFKARASAAQLLSIALATAGALCFFGPGCAQGWQGLLLALGSAFSYAFLVLALEHTWLNSLDVRLLVLYQFGCVAVSGALLGAFTGAPFLPSSPLQLLLIFVCGLLTLAGYACFQLGVRGAGAQSASLLGVLEPISSIALAYPLLRQSASGQQLLASAVMLVAVFLLLLSNKRNPGGK